MARASLQAGMAFTNALLGATHAIAHQIGGALDLPHGLLNALGIPRGLHEIGVEPADFDVFAVNALRDAYIATNPRPVSEDDVRRICVAAY
jgi:alcohol dehydrogenase class IV